MERQHRDNLKISQSYDNLYRMKRALRKVHLEQTNFLAEVVLDKVRHLSRFGGVYVADC